MAKGLDNNTKGLKTHYLGFGFTLGIRRNCRLLMKSTKVQTHGELLMHGTTNWWAGLLVCVYSWSSASSSRRAWHGLVDSMLESIHALCCDFLCFQIHRASRPSRGKPVLISILLVCSLCFHDITLEYSTFTKFSKLKSSQCSAQPLCIGLLLSRSAWWQKMW